jgi:hypothetical protein
MDSGRTNEESSAIVIGIGDGKATKTLGQGKWRRLFTIRLPGEAMVTVPGVVFDASSPTAAAEFIGMAYTDHHEMVHLECDQFFDRHPLQIEESVRRAFLVPFYKQLGDKTLEFGDDIMDGMQGAYHLAKNAKYLLPGPSLNQMLCGNVPALSIAAGPSLKKHMDAIRALSPLNGPRKVLTICCDSLLDGLLKEGIHVDLCTPVERTKQIADAFSKTGYDVPFAGKCVVHQDVVEKFKNHWFVPCTDVLYGWGGAQGNEMFSHGQSTGTMCQSVATTLTTGPVYMVGHDLSMGEAASHVDFAKAVAVHNQECFPTDGYSGQVMTDWWWDMFRRHIEWRCKTHGNCINVNELDGIGARIHHSKPGRLPSPIGMLDFTMPATPAPNIQRYEQFRDRCRMLPRDARGALVKLSSSQLTAGDTGLQNLFESENWRMFAYALRSLYAQFSLEAKAGRPKKQVVDGCRDALISSIRGLMPMLEDMALCT